ncbi:hypothetical protein HY339_02260 [Candidatus Gottesmanbacteria bacterium]|nr:hypothetical protein [Candidatus Gottesmanbacteria bacterium]
MAKATLQIPMDSALKARAAAAARVMGFSSLQESIRVWLSQIVRQTPIIRYEEPAVQLSPRAIRRYNKMMDDIESGKEPVYVAHSADDFLDQLYGRKPKVQSDVL